MATGTRDSDFRLLEHIIAITSADLDVGEVTQRVADVVTVATGSDVCFVHLVDEERRRVVLAGATPPFDKQVGNVELALGEGIAGWVAKHATPTVVPDKWQDARYRYIPELRGEDYASMMSVPMLVRGRVVGVLNVHSTTRTYGDDDLALLAPVSNLMARAIENARLYGRLAEREEKLERFASRTVEAQELERRRLAGEIHDGISQRLVSLWYHLLAAEDAVGEAEAVGRELAMAKALVTEALGEARAAITGLRPPVLDDLGLAPGLESLARSLTGLEVEVDVESVDLPAHVEVALYRIAQEALQNVVKHAEASSVVVRLRRDGRGVRLLVSDDGKGFDEDTLTDAEDRHSYGMVGIRERAELIGAALAVASRPATGTTVEVVVPDVAGPG
jgi:signal transduction histidine kinase